jgi:hypothetical protein
MSSEVQLALLLLYKLRRQRMTAATALQLSPLHCCKQPPAT